MFTQGWDVSQLEACCQETDRIPPEIGRIKTSIPQLLNSSPKPLPLIAREAKEVEPLGRQHQDKPATSEDSSAALDLASHNTTASTAAPPRGSPGKHITGT